MKLIYIGNCLTRHGGNATTIDTLGPLLRSPDVSVRMASARRNKILRMLHMCWTVLRFGPSADYVLIDTYSTSNFWYAVIISQLCRLMRIAYIPILHGGRLPERLARNPILSHMIFKYAWRNVAPSGYLKAHFREAGFEVVSIPNPIDFSGYAYLQRTSVRPRLLWVRALADLYHPEMAIEVAASLQTRFDDVKLCMVGPDKENRMAGLQQFAVQKGVAIQFTGQLSKTEWTALSASYDLFLNTTHFDNTPVSVIEALALGLPVISTNVGGIPYVLQDGRDALLVPDGDVAQMAAAVTRLVENPALATQLSANGKSVAAAFDARSVRELWMALLAG